MKNFIIKELKTENIEKELESIGFDSAYKSKAANKYRYKTLKIYDLTLPQANILKQTAISFGADCGVHRDILTANIQKTDVILGGSYSQLLKISEKLSAQPFSMINLSEQIKNFLTQKQNKKTKIVGILNITPDSFSDGGLYTNEQDAFKHLLEMISDGADIIDIGAESTKPYSESISDNEQIKRLEPVLKLIRKENIDIPISIDTRSSVVADFALNNGANIINDVSGMDYDKKIAEVVAKHNATIVIQHSKGTPETMQNNTDYSNLIDEIYLSLLEKINYAKGIGINKIIADVGIGFGKTQAQNFELLERIEELYSLNVPIMVGVSRKSLLNVSANDNELKDALSLAISYPLIQKNVDYLRVHSVKIHKQLAELVKNI